MKTIIATLPIGASVYPKRLHGLGALFEPVVLTRRFTGTFFIMQNEHNVFTHHFDEPINGYIGFEVHRHEFEN